MITETRNYLWRCVNPCFAASALSAFAARAYGSVVFRTSARGSPRFQPKTVHMAAQRFLRTIDAAFVPSAAAHLPKRSLTLTTGGLEVRAGSDWHHRFDDMEITVSLHRWNWLLRGLTDDAETLRRCDGLALMRSWISECLSDAAFGMDAYSTGERIVNGSLFLLLSGEGTIPSDIAAAFRFMSRQVASHLEYHDSAQTGNHAFNNARALLFAGLITESSTAVDLAEAIARERLPNLVTADGFLREGSSHYQFLFARWVLEMLWMAERGKLHDLVALLKPYAAMLVSRCWFFLVQQRSDDTWSIPLIGDVSPDFPPEWLIGLPWSSLALAVFDPGDVSGRPPSRGWSDLFNAPGTRAATSLAPLGGAFPASGWFRADDGPWTLFVRAEAGEGALEASHKHRDLGSFVLFECGSPLLVDIGRLDYTESALSRYGRSAVGHNTMLLDGLGPSVDGPTWLAGGYSRVRADVTVAPGVEQTVVTIKHDGFRRTGRNIRHERRLYLEHDKFVVQDRCEGSGSCHVRIRFHFAPGYELQSMTDGWAVVGSGDTFQVDRGLAAVVQSGQRTALPGGLFFPAYGQEQIARTLDLSADVSLPVVFTHSLIAGNS